MCRQRQVTVPTVACVQVVEERWAWDKSCTIVEVYQQQHFGQFLHNFGSLEAAAFWTSLSFEPLEFCIGQVLHYCEIKSITIVRKK